MKLSKSIGYSSLIVFSYLSFSYYCFQGWYYSSIGTVLIMLFSYLLWKKQFLIITGLDINLFVILKSLGYAICTIICSVMIIKHIGNKHNVAIQFNDLRDYYHDIFYILNEEIIFGGISLYFLIKKFKFKPLVTSVLLALVFSLIHYISYRWIFLDKGIIKIITLITLFLVGIIRNNLIIVTGHIGYSWALHFGWMVVMFGSIPHYISDNSRLAEPDIFNMFLGSYEMLILSGIFTGISILYMLKKFNYK